MNRSYLYGYTFPVIWWPKCIGCVTQWWWLNVFWDYSKGFHSIITFSQFYPLINNIDIRFPQKFCQDYSRARYILISTPSGTQKCFDKYSSNAFAFWFQVQVFLSKWCIPPQLLLEPSKYMCMYQVQKKQADFIFLFSALVFFYEYLPSYCIFPSLPSSIGHLYRRSKLYIFWSWTNTFCQWQIITICPPELYTIIAVLKTYFLIDK